MMGKRRRYLGLKFLAHAVLLVGFDDKVMVVKVLDDKVVLVIHREQDLFHGRVAAQ